MPDIIRRRRPERDRAAYVNNRGGPQLDDPKAWGELGAELGTADDDSLDV